MVRQGTFALTAAAARGLSTLLRFHSAAWMIKRLARYATAILEERIHIQSILQWSTRARTIDDAITSAIEWQCKLNT